MMGPATQTYFATAADLSERGQTKRRRQYSFGDGSFLGKRRTSHVVEHELLPLYAPRRPTLTLLTLGLLLLGKNRWHGDGNNVVGPSASCVP